MRETISIKLFKTLQKGKDRLNKEALAELRSFVESQRADNDTFVDRSGESDLYYTLFGWILSYILDIKLDHNKMSTYLEQQDADSMDLIHYAAFMRCKTIVSLYKKGMFGTFINSLKSKSIKSLQEFNQIPHNDQQSPYTQFIWLSVVEDTGNKLNNKAEIINALAEYSLPSGGYVNTKGSASASTNASSAALSIIGELKGYKENKDVTFLKDTQEEYGGFKAAGEAPVADLLSTATSLFTLRCYGVSPKYSSNDFIESHWLDKGGFSATILDEESDVEYTFYGLLALGAMN
ncbi:MAG: prenyltransferase/squalene oxidase repeat-containing protein [Bacteroidales bacterium]